MTLSKDKFTGREVAAIFDMRMDELVLRSGQGSLVSIPMYVSEQRFPGMNEAQIGYYALFNFGEFFPYEDSKSILM